MTKIICDECGKQTNVWPVVLSIGAFNKEKYDLCVACHNKIFKSFYEWLKQYKGF